MENITLYPADIYQVVDKSLLSEHDRLVLTMLYMPIIGYTPIMLYLKLQTEARNSYISEELTHHHLMTSMSLTLDNIKDSRIKLEAIGLLKSYYLEGNVNSYIYELYSPMSVQEFFSHPIFNVVLFNNVGKNEYQRLYDFFKLPHVSLKGYTEITRPFDSVFKSRNYTSLEIGGEDVIEKNKLLLNYELDFDFDLFSSSMPKDIFNDKCLNKTMKELITHLSFLYEIDPVSMANVAKSSLNEKGNIDRDELRKNTRKYYEFSNDNRLPSLIFKKEREFNKSAAGDNSNRGRIIQVFENKSPYDFLKTKYRGANPTPRDMEILEMLLVDVKLNPSVINVLIDFTLKTNNNKLSKKYIETIAGHWKRAGIDNAKDAMNFAEKEYKKNNKKSSTTQKVTNNSKVVPSWLNSEIASTGEIDNNDFNDFLEEFRK